jgi:hypothetical protein
MSFIHVPDLYHAFGGRSEKERWWMDGHMHERATIDISRIRTGVPKENAGRTEKAP